MYSGEFESLSIELDAIVAHWRANASMRAVLSRVENGLELTHLERDLSDLKEGSPAAIQWRVMDHCSAVGRLYAVYEHFCEKILHDWLQFMAARKPFLKLPEEIISYYPKGFAHVLSMLPSPRYDQLTVEDMIAGYNAALNGNPNYKLMPECLTHHRMNLRWDELNEIYRRFGMSEVAHWLSKDTEITDFFGTGGKKTIDQVAAKLAELVQYRNDVSHGAVSVGEILGQQQFLEFVNFVRILCSSLNDMHRSYALELLLETREAHKVGIMTERYSGNIVICKMKTGTLSKGQIISFLADGYCVERRVLTMQIDDVEVDAMNFDREMELGIKLDGAISRKKAAVITNSAW